MGQSFSFNTTGIAEIAKLLGYQAKAVGKKVLVCQEGESDWFEFPNMLNKKCEERDVAIEDIGLQIVPFDQDGKFLGICSYTTHCFIVGPCDKQWYVDVAAFYSALLLREME